MVVGFDAEMLETELVTVWYPAGGDQQMSAGDVPLYACAADVDVAAGPGDVRARGVGDHVDAVGFESLLHHRRDVDVLRWDQSLAALDDGHLGAESSKHLGELGADETATDDDEMFGEFAKVENGPRRQVGDRIESVDAAGGVSGSGVQEDLVRRDRRGVDFESVVGDESGSALDEVKTVPILYSPV